MKRLPLSVLARRFGNPGRRIWYMCQGADTENLQFEVPAPKSIGHGKVVPPVLRRSRMPNVIAPAWPGNPMGTGRRSEQ
jgi:hypothetical protein